MNLAVMSSNRSIIVMSFPWMIRRIVKSNDGGSFGVTRAVGELKSTGDFMFSRDVGMSKRPRHGVQLRFMTTAGLGTDTRRR